MVKTNEAINLTVTERTVFGKNLAKLRREGLIPGNVFGPKFDSKSVSVNLKDFVTVYKVAHETGVVYLKLGKEEVPVLIRQVQYHPVKDSILHVDFRKIDLTQKIETEVPVKIMGVSTAVTQKGGVQLIQSQLLKIEALPTKIPSSIEVDISKITELGQEIKVADLAKSADYEVKEDPEKVVVSVVEHKEESVTPETTAAAPEVITEKPAEGEVPAEEGAKESAKTPEKPSEAPAKEEKK